LRPVLLASPSAPQWGSQERVRRAGRREWVKESSRLPPEIDVADPERQHGFDAAVNEYQHLLEVYSSVGYEVTIR
jgi:hypothetical protein